MTNGRCRIRQRLEKSFKRQVLSRTACIKRHVGGHAADWLAYFKNGEVAPDYLRMFESVRDLLQSDGRSLVQGALAWLWARSDNTLPIPGFKSVAQVDDICGTLKIGPMHRDIVAEIEAVISRPEEGEPRSR
jgi:aryl-alcohol dehydrogenase-like predicted oxidoreductase